MSASPWTAPDARRLLVQAMADDALLKAVAALRASAPDYLTGLLRAGHDEGRAETDLRALLDLAPDAVLAEAEPTWGLLVGEAARRGLALPAAPGTPSDPPLSEVADLLAEVRAVVAERFPVPFHEIQAARAGRTLLGHPLLPLSWVDLMRLFPGLRLGGLRLFEPGDAAFSDPEIQVHKDLVVFGRSGKDLLHAYGKSGRCYVLPRDAAQRGKVRQARLAAPGFVAYLRAVLPAAVAAQRQRLPVMPAPAAGAPAVPSASEAVPSALPLEPVSVPPSETPAPDAPAPAPVPDPVPDPVAVPEPAPEPAPEAAGSAEATEPEPAPAASVPEVVSVLPATEALIPTGAEGEPPPLVQPALSEQPAPSDGGGSALDPDLAAALAAPSEPPASAKPPAPSAEARRRRSEAMLARWRLAPPPLPAGLSDEEAILRPAGAVAWRALCLMTLLAWASGFSLADEARAVGVPDETVQHVFGQEVARRLTARERMFLAADPPPDAEREAMGLKAESLAVLLRALGVLKRLPMPNEDVDPALVFNLGFEVLVRGGKRPPLAITEAMALDLRDFYQRLHWIQRMAQLRGQKGPTGLRGEVLRERRHAIEWLVRSYESGFVEWDRVDIGLPLPVA